MACASLFPSVSPDNQRVAYLENEALKVKDLASQAVVVQWRVPFGAWGGPAWSPTGQELCLGAGSSVGDRTGLWIYPLDSNERVKVLTSQVMAASWAPDGTKLVFALRPPYFELWTADLDPALSTVKALGPGQTLAEHWQQMLWLYTRRTQADPQDASAYSDRARYYDYLRERTKADADMRRWSAAMSGQSLPDPWFSTLGDCRCVIDMPFDCELVFSAERPVNTIPMMSIAFGQKGRWEMRLFRVPMVATSFLSLCLSGGLGVPAVQADFIFGTPTNLGPTINSGPSNCAPCLSPDGLELYFQRGEPSDMLVSRRTTPDGEWGAPVAFGPTINTPGAYEGGASISADGLSLYFGSSSQGLFVMKRATLNDNWGTPVSLGINGYAASVSADELELYFQAPTGAYEGGYGGWDVWVTTRASADDQWGTPVNLGPTINTSYGDNWPGISPDGLVLFFASTRPGGLGNWDLYMARRATKKDPWGPPVNLGPAVNTTSWEVGAKVSWDGSTLYWHSARPGGFGSFSDIWQAPMIPTVDFNADQKVDLVDLVMLIDNWGTAKTLCDIGPMPWGDGVVDERDLRVLMESLMTPGPKASDVPCDAGLSWISPSFAQTCDVYLGTSQEAVKTASRTNPQGVLVSKGQTATTYDPPGALDFSETYYWRVDFVISSPAPAIYQGPVLKFTTEAYAYPIKNITATASSFQRGMGPEKTVDGSGLDQNDGHSTNGAEMWLSQGTQPNWIQYQFDKVYTLHELWVWNQNQAVEPFIGFGAKTVRIEYSTDGTTWTPLPNVPEFAKASGKPDYVHNTTVSFGGVSAKYVKLAIEKGWGATPSAGLSEVRFFCIPDRSTPKP